jgi:hypothetical protein
MKRKASLILFQLFLIGQIPVANGQFTPADGSYLKKKEVNAY